MTDSTLHETPLHSWHVEHGGRMVDFAGWSMPVQYTSIVDEHHAVRKRAGAFDISHMGRLWFAGPDAERFLDRLLTNDVTKLKVDQIRYSLVTNEDAGILDDVLIYRWTDAFALVVNASNREKIVAWIEQHIGGYNVQFVDRTFELGMIAIQGPAAIAAVQPHFSVDISSLKYYSGAAATEQGPNVWVTRTGYTGEDGCEVIAPPEIITALWDDFVTSKGVTPCGLGCRDTLRLEAAMPLYGHELSESIDPFTAGLDFAVKLGAGDFIGKSKLQTLHGDPSLKKRVGIIIDGKRIAREGTPLFSGDREIGTVTSGTQSPTLEKSIAMAYVAPEFSAVGTILDADFRGKRLPAQIVTLPFYRRG